MNLPSPCHLMSLFHEPPSPLANDVICGRPLTGLDKKALSSSANSYLRGVCRVQKIIGLRHREYLFFSRSDGHDIFPIFLLLPLDAIRAYFAHIGFGSSCNLQQMARTREFDYKMDIWSHFFRRNRIR